LWVGGGGLCGGGGEGGLWGGGGGRGGDGGAPSGTWLNQAEGTTAAEAPAVEVSRTMPARPTLCAPDKQGEKHLCPAEWRGCDSQRTSLRWKDQNQQLRVAVVQLLLSGRCLADKHRRCAEADKQLASRLMRLVGVKTGQCWHGDLVGSRMPTDDAQLHAKDRTLS